MVLELESSWGVISILHNFIEFLRVIRDVLGETKIAAAALDCRSLKGKFPTCPLCVEGRKGGRIGIWDGWKESRA